MSAVVLAVLICTVGFGITVSAKTTTCNVKKCNNYAVCGSDYCSYHKCGYSGCTKKAGSSGYCSTHSKKKSKGSENASTSKTCAVNKCTKNKAKDSDYCSKHTCEKKKCFKQTVGKGTYCPEHLKDVMPDCDDYEDINDFLDDWDGRMPDGSDAEDYWFDW